jgi:hypothetical protein
MVFLNRSIFRTTGSPTTTCRFFCAQIEVETDPDLSDDLLTAARGALMARGQETRSSARKFARERTYARKLAAEYFERFPKDRYRTEVESWRELQSQNIEFTMKRLREPI